MLRCEWQQFSVVPNAGTVLLASELQEFLTNSPDGEVLCPLRPVLILGGGMASLLGTGKQKPQVSWVQLGSSEVLIHTCQAQHAATSDRLRVRFPPEVQWNQVKLLVIAMLGDEIAHVLQSPGGNPSADTHKSGKIQDFLRQ